MYIYIYIYVYTSISLSIDAPVGDGLEAELPLVPGLQPLGVELPRLVLVLYLHHLAAASGAEPSPIQSMNIIKCMN